MGGSGHNAEQHDQARTVEYRRIDWIRQHITSAQLAVLSLAATTPGPSTQHGSERVVQTGAAEE